MILFSYRDTDLEKIQELQRRYHDAVIIWLPVRDITIQQVQEAAEELRIHLRNVNIVRVTGASTSIGGSLLAILGFGLAPVTFGGSIALSAVGIGIAVAGGVTAAGASIADIAIEKSNMKDVQQQINRDYEELKAILELTDKMNIIISETKSLCPDIDNSTFAILIADVSVIKGGRLRITAALTIGGTAERSIACIASNIAFTPIDVIAIVRNGWKLGSETKVVIKLREVAAEMEKQNTS